MNRKSKHIILLLPLLSLSVSIVFAQTKGPEDVTGKITGRSADGKGWHFEMLNNLSGSSSKYYAAMKANLMKALPILVAPSVVNPPMGFEIDPSLTAYQAHNRESNIISGNITFFCFDYTMNNDGTPGFHKSGETGSILHFYINDVSALFDTLYENKRESDHTPTFFFKPHIKKINSHLLQVGNQAEVIKKSGIPLFVPLTKKEYLAFLLKKMNKSLHGAQEAMKRTINQTIPRQKQKLQKAKKEYNELLKNKAMRSSFEDHTKFLSDSITIQITPGLIVHFQQNVKDTKKNISKLQQWISRYQKELKNNPGSPAYVLNDVNHVKVILNVTFYPPVSPGDEGAKALAKINPEYFDKSLPETTVQVIVIDYSTSRFNPDFLEKDLGIWLKGIDTDVLGKMIRK